MVDGVPCIDFQIRNKIASVPSHITFTKYPKPNRVCKEVLESEPVKAYFDSKAGPLSSSVIIGTRTRIYN